MEYLTDEFGLERFVRRQKTVYGSALEQIKKGKKEGCWMWYIFPQHQRLGRSRKSFVFSLNGADQARAYLEHPILGPRIIECSEALLSHKDKTAEEIFGDIDAVKLRSSMTMFALVSGGNSVFHDVLNQFFGGVADWKTKVLLCYINKNIKENDS